MSDSDPNLLASLEEEEARLRQRLDKIVQMKKLALELEMPPNVLPRVILRRVSDSGADRSQSYDGTLGSLIQCYKAHPRSPFHQLKYAVQNNYAGVLNKLDKDFGHWRISALTADRVMEFYNQWAEGGKIAMGHALAGKLRLVSGFGATVLHDTDCILFASIMRAMRFPITERRLVVMTAEHAEALRKKAHELGWGSIALAQAIQFELKLRQVETIGEWVPISDPMPSLITWGNEKWVRGLRWSDLDDKLILRFTVHDKLKRKKDFEVDLSEKKMVLQELDKLQHTPTSGPMIICEATDRPFTHAEFRRKWRLVATKAGLPDNVRNSDSIRAVSGGQEAEAQPSTLRRVK